MIKNNISVILVLKILIFLKGSAWLFVTPWGFRKLLNYIARTYGNPEIILTENGCSTSHPVEEPGDTLQLQDDQRCRYLTSYINEALKGNSS